MGAWGSLGCFNGESGNLNFKGCWESQRCVEDCIQFLSQVLDSGSWGMGDLPHFAIPMVLSFMEVKEVCKCACLAKQWAACLLHEPVLSKVSTKTHLSPTVRMLLLSSQVSGS